MVALVLPTTPQCRHRFPFLRINEESTYALRTSSPGRSNAAVRVGVGDAHALANCAVQLLTDESVRVRLATKGVKATARMTLQHSSNQLEQVLQSLLA